MPPSGRMRRVDEAMREVLSDAVTSDLKDPRVGFVTVTGVDTSPDLSQAKVFVSVLGDERTRKLTIEGLQAAHGYLQRRVSDELRIKRTPTLEFLYDDTVEKADRLERLLSDSEEESG